MLSQFQFFVISVPEYILVGNTLNISGTGTITSTDVNKKSVASIHIVIIKEGITKIQSGSFSKCSSLREISLPNSLIQMEGCLTGTKIEEIFIPSGLELISMANMWNGTPLKSILVNSTNKNFSEYKNCLLNKKQTHLYGFVNTKNFELPSTLTSIGTWAVSYKKDITLNIPDGVQKLSQQTFVDSVDCKVIFSPNSNLTEIPDYCFHQSMNSEFVLPPRVTKISIEAFYGSGITSFSFHPNSELYEISDKAFNVCGSLLTVRLPKNLTKISPSAFEGCSSLEEITLEEGSKNFYDNGFCIASIDNKKLLWVNHNLTNFTIGDDVEIIFSSVLQACENLENLSISPLNDRFAVYDNVVYTQFFNEPTTVTGGITKCEIHKNCTVIPSSFFRGLKKLQSVTFAPESVCTKLEQYCFAYCKNLNTIKLADSISTISTCALRSTGIISLILPAKLTILNGFQWENTELTEVIFNENCPLTSLPGNTFGYNPKLSKIVLSKKIESINSNVFLSCNISSIFIPKSVSYLGQNCFSDNKRLVNVTFESGSNCSTISYGAFKSTRIESITLPANLVDLSTLAFSDCKNLKNVEFEDGSKLTDIVSQVFMSCSSMESFTIPPSVISIDPMAFYKCFKLKKFEVRNSSRYESIDGAIYEMPDRVLILFPPGKDKATIADSTIKISNNAFYGCSLLSSLDFGTSVVTSIGELTFFECSNLRSLSIPKTVETIMARAFEGCTAMTSIEFANESKLLSIGASTFLGCGNLTSVKFPEGALLERIEDHTFEDCVLLSYFKFTSNLNTIGNSAFSNCKSLRSVLLNGTNITTISSSAFKGCESLSVLSLPEKLKAINEMAFQRTSIKNLYIPSETEKMEFGCFSQCSYLENVFYCGQNKFENNLAFANSQKVVVYTLLTYEPSMFNGLPVVKIMERCGVFPTKIFTNSDPHTQECTLTLALVVLTKYDEITYHSNIEKIAEKSVV